MNRNKMKRMLKAGIDPVDVSIVKWQEILRKVKRSDYKGARESNTNCALCEVYGGIGMGCGGCPLNPIDNCNQPDSIYKEASVSINSRAIAYYETKAPMKKQAIIKAVENMLDKLKECKVHELPNYTRNE